MENIYKQFNNVGTKKGTNLQQKVVTPITDKIGKLGKANRVIRISQKNDVLNTFISNCIDNSGTIERLQRRDALTEQHDKINLEKRNYYNKRKLKKHCKKLAN